MVKKETIEDIKKKYNEEIKALNNVLKEKEGFMIKNFIEDSNIHRVNNMTIGELTSQLTSDQIGNMAEKLSKIKHEMRGYNSEYDSDKSTPEDILKTINKILQLK